MRHRFLLRMSTMSEAHTYGVSCMPYGVSQFTMVTYLLRNKKYILLFLYIIVRVGFKTRLP